MESAKRTETELIIRWMIRADMSQVLAIEREAFDYPWDEKTFVLTIIQRNVIGLVAEADSRIVGYAVYALQPRRIDLLNLAVRNTHRRLGIGTAMIDKLKGKLSLKRRVSITADVIDTNDRGHAFFHSQGFKARLLPDYDELPDGELRDAYRFQFSVSGRGRRPTSTPKQRRAS